MRLIQISISVYWKEPTDINEVSKQWTVKCRAFAVCAVVVMNGHAVKVMLDSLDLV